jgi:hypothetical protein
MWCFGEHSLQAERDGANIQAGAMAAKRCITAPSVLHGGCLRSIVVVLTVIIHKPDALLLENSRAKFKGSACWVEIKQVPVAQVKQWDIRLRQEAPLHGCSKKAGQVVPNHRHSHFWRQPHLAPLDLQGAGSQQFKWCKRPQGQEKGSYSPRRESTIHSWRSDTRKKKFHAVAKSILHHPLPVQFPPKLKLTSLS